MEPFTFFIIIVSLISSGAIGAGAMKTLKKRKRKAFYSALSQNRIRVLNQDLSIFALFWDLGVSDYALEIMAAQKILPHDLDDVPSCLVQLEYLVQNYETYGAFSQDMLEAIQEFYDLHKDVGPRRQVPALQSADRKSIKISAVAESNALVPYHDPTLNLDHDIDGRVAARSGDIPMLGFGSDGDVIDIDQVGVVNALDFLEGLFYGSFGNKLDKWFKLRQLRQLKSNLDRELVGFHQYFVNQMKCVPHFVDHIYDVSKRWKREKNRIEALRIKRPWAAKPWSRVADLLVDRSIDEANSLQHKAKMNVDTTLAKISSTAGTGNRSLAGYLVYLNHHAFFAGRSEGYGEGVRKIEAAAYHVQQEIMSLKSKGVI